MNAPSFFTRVIGAGALCLGLATGVLAQSAFSPAITVNDQIITYYEIEQRSLLMTLMNAPGDVRKEARDRLIEERLQVAEAHFRGIRPSEEGVMSGIAEFAGRAGLEPDELIKALEKEGIAEETLRDFIYSGMAWRGLVQSRYGRSVQITEPEIDRAIASNTGAGGLNVLLSEIVMAVTPQNAAQVRALANQLASITTATEFESAAKQYSQAATKDEGGKLDWLSITKLPAEIRPSIMALGPNEVTQPIQLPNAIALFQMRGKSEGATSAPRYSAIDYAVLRLPGGRTAENLELTRDIAGRIDTCDDLFGEARVFPAEYLTREALEPSKIPRDISLELAKLDANEVSTALTQTASTGQQQMLMLMLCGRTAELGEEISREEVAAILRNQRLQSFARGYLAQLRSDAKITEAK
ncbi:peptidylprolyl isomerase [uncultured Shimia sp.]|uniref:peptidylprolyl isomerase n=1 Tax=uncultured Shimia sp. TaxID=573152 RepID=UPI00261AC4C8|nr:peptidylprolyl isomerase [uncultured Shimia sp.]